MNAASDCKNDKVSNISIELVDESPYHLIGGFPGPEDTPYEGGRFEVVRIPFPCGERQES
jgi:ubiquitin-conjugating enzyme (huntingtin interacting protein 2)